MNNLSTYELGKFRFFNHTINKTTNEPHENTGHIRGITTVNGSVYAGGSGFVKELNHSFYKTIPENASNFTVGFDGVFVRVFRMNDDDMVYVLPYRPTTLTNTHVNGSKMFEQYLVNSGVKLSTITPGWCYYFQIVDPHFVIGSSLPVSTVVYYGRQRMVDETNKPKYTLDNYKYEITDMELPETKVVKADYKEIVSVDEKNYKQFPKLIYPVELSKQEAVDLLSMDECVVMMVDGKMCRMNNENYNTRKSFRQPGNHVKSCAVIIDAIINQNVSYNVNGKIYPSSRETRITDAIEMCKFIYPKFFYPEIVSLHIVMENLRKNLTHAIINDYMNNDWKKHPRVVQICNQAYGHAKRMNNQQRPTMDMIVNNIKYLMDRERYDSMFNMNDTYKIVKF
jgi:hypothetical protein